MHLTDLDLAQVKPLLEAIGQGILDCGDDPRAGNAMKLVGNFFISSWMELVAEGMTLAEKNGVARQSIVDFVTRLFPGHITAGMFLSQWHLSSRIGQFKGNEAPRNQSSQV